MKPISFTFFVHLSLSVKEYPLKKKEDHLLRPEVLQLIEHIVFEDKLNYIFVDCCGKRWPIKKLWLRNCFGSKLAIKTGK